MDVSGLYCYMFFPFCHKALLSVCGYVPHFFLYFIFYFTHEALFLIALRLCPLSAALFRSFYS